MRLSNRNKATVYNLAHTALLVVLLCGCVAFLLNEFRTHHLGWESYFLIAIPLLLLGIFYWRGRQIFEYDSDGEALNFKNRNVVPFLSHNASDEFPKYKLQKFEIVDGIIFKRLYIFIYSKKSSVVTLKYDVSYLSTKELRDLRISLNKVVKQNTESREIN